MKSSLVALIIIGELFKKVYIVAHSACLRRSQVLHVVRYDVSTLGWGSRTFEYWYCRNE